MKRALPAVLGALLVLVVNASPAAAIIGGTTADEPSRPWAVQVLIIEKGALNGLCGGTLVPSRRVGDDGQMHQREIGVGHLRGREREAPSTSRPRAMPASPSSSRSGRTPRRKTRSRPTGSGAWWRFRSQASENARHRPCRPQSAGDPLAHKRAGDPARFRRGWRWLRRLLHPTPGRDRSGHEDHQGDGELDEAKGQLQVQCGRRRERLSVRAETEEIPQEALLQAL